MTEKPMTLDEFAKRVRSGNGLIKVLVEKEQGHAATDAQIKAWYEIYLREGGWR